MVPATRYDEIFEVAAEFMSPPSVKVALEGERAAIRSEAMEAELSLWENEVLETEGKLVRKRVIGTEWVLRVKKDSEGNLEKYKAGVVAKGFKRMEGGDCNEAFTPVVRFENVRALVALATSMGWELDQMDVATSFLYAKLVEETYVDIPEGVVLVRGEGRVWKLISASMNSNCPHGCGR